MNLFLAQILSYFTYFSNSNRTFSRNGLPHPIYFILYVHCVPPDLSNESFEEKEEFFSFLRNYHSHLLILYFL